MKQTTKTFLLLIILISLMGSFLSFPVHATTSSIIISPNGNSTPLECLPTTTNYADVDEYPTPDDATTCVTTIENPNSWEDNYTLPNAGVPSDATINNITVTVRLLASGVGSGSHAAARIITVDKIKYTSGPLGVATSWTTYTSTFTNASWTPAMVNSMYCGIMLTSTLQWAVSLTQEFINITYTSGGTSLTTNGVANMQFSTGKLLGVQYSLTRTATANFVTVATQSLSHSLSIIQSVILSFTTAIVQTFSVTFQKTAILDFSSTHMIGYALPKLGSTSLNLNSLSVFSMVSGHLLTVTGSVILSLQTLIFTSPLSAFWKILAMFSIVMLFVGGALFLVEKQQKKKSQRDDGNNS